MLLKWQFNVLIGLGALALLLALADGVLFTLNFSAKGVLSQRQQFVQQTVPLEGLYRDIVKALAELALKNNDRQVLDMLAGQGINVTPNAAEAPARKGEK
jgi:hypothetical protein